MIIISEDFNGIKYLNLNYFIVLVIFLCGLLFFCNDLDPPLADIVVFGFSLSDFP